MGGTVNPLVVGSSPIRGAQLAETRAYNQEHVSRGHPVPLTPRNGRLSGFLEALVVDMPVSDVEWILMSGEKRLHAFKCAARYFGQPVVSPDRR